jgi:hypothetical protein
MKTIKFEIKKMSWSDSDLEFLKQNYPNKGKDWCVKSLGKSEGAIRSMSAKLGLRINKDSEFFIDFQKRAAESKIGKKKPEHSQKMKQHYIDGKLSNWVEATRKRVESGEASRIMKEKIKTNGHPRGFLNGKHNEETKKKLSEISKRMWSNKDHYVNSDEMKQKRSDVMSKSQALGKVRSGYSRGKMGTYNINGRDIFFRSLWEANFALYLDKLKDENEIKDWDFEKDVFWFDKIKRGVRSYKPDFKIFMHDDSFYYIEVKGYMDSKSKTKLKRMRIYYPEIKLELVDQKKYKQLIKDYADSIKFFG